MNTLEQLERGELAGARRLDLQADLTELPAAVAGLADSLEVLNLTGNRLTHLPHWLSGFRKLKVVFASHNWFTVLPEVLGELPQLDVVGFRACAIGHVPDESLAPSVRSIILTENRITALPAAVGGLARLQKLMLTGNALQTLPQALAQAGQLELLRIAANQIQQLPTWLTTMPRLAWLAASGNRLADGGAASGAQEAFQPSPVSAPSRQLRWEDLDLGALLGQGASGSIHRVSMRRSVPGVGVEGAALALKVFKGSVTSDGRPEDEMLASLAASGHQALLAGLARVSGAPGGGEAMLMPLVATGAEVLAGPPSLDSCTRDLYAPDWQLCDPAAALRLTTDAAQALAWLHERGMLHGDFYAHNILWTPATGDAQLSDMGAALRLPPGVPGGRAAWQALDVCAFGIWLDEVADRLAGEAAESLATPIRRVAMACQDEDVRSRPCMAEVVALLPRQLGKDGVNGVLSYKDDRR